MNTNSPLTKRDREFSQTNDGPKLKKQKKDSFKLHELPEEICEYLASYLVSPKDVTNFELACKSHRSLTTHYWEKKIRREGCNFTSPLAQIVPTDHPKERYIFNRILFKLSLTAWGKPLSFENSQHIYPKTRRVEHRFPELHQLLLFSLNQKISSAKVNPFLETTRPLQQRIFEEITDEKPNPCHLIMQSLFESEALRAFGCFELAAKGNPAAAYLAVKMPEPILKLPPSPLWFRNRCFKIALAAAEQKYYKALEHCLERWPEETDNLLSQNISHPPILFRNSHTLRHNSNFEEAEKFLLAALQGYGQNAPAKLLIDLVVVKTNLKKSSAAEALIPQVLGLCEFEGIKASAYFLDYAASIKRDLKKYIESESYYEKAFLAYKFENTPIPARCLDNAAFVKLKLHNYEEAENLYREAFQAFKSENIPIPARCLDNAAFVKLKLRKKKEAENLYKESFQASKSMNIACSPDSLLNAAVLKVNFQKNKEAESLLTEYFQALKSKNTVCSAASLSSAGVVNLYLKKYKEADELYREAFTIAMNEKTPLPASYLANAAFAKKQLGIMDEANKLATEALNLFNTEGETKWTTVDDLFDEIERVLNVPNNEEEEGD